MILPVLDAPVSPLRQRLIDDMTMRRFSRETQRNYIRDVGRLATFLGRSPDEFYPCRVAAGEAPRHPSALAQAGCPSVLGQVRWDAGLPAQS
ncbi:hypothetical protein [Enterovirga aerilata]|uniref:hypothetical protein n=1 Tax=Enterovirga aerilata TaxID=2730920 RepID=UPI001FEFEF5E|nr:hypothetical protein [Enterovirga sp. DB1703]